MATNPLDKPTLVERFVGLIPLPYPLAALAWALLVPSGLLLYAIQSLTTGGSVLAPSPGQWINHLLNTAFALYALLIVRYIRRRVLSLEGELGPRLRGGTDAYRAAFRRMTRSGPVVALTAIFAVAILASYAFLGILLPDAFDIGGNVAVVLLDALAFSTFVWEFASVSFGLHGLGGSSLTLASFQDDRMLGSAPMGRLALTLAVAYFGGLLIAFLLFTSFVPFSIAGTAAFVATILAGVGLFFLPLGRIHSRMRDEKLRLLREISTRYPRLDATSPTVSGAASLEDLRAGVAKLADLQAVTMLERKIQDLPTWPFDVQVTSRFVTIVVSVTAVLLARVITDLLHF